MPYMTAPGGCSFFITIHCTFCWKIVAARITVGCFCSTVLWALVLCKFELLVSILVYSAQIMDVLSRPALPSVVVWLCPVVSCLFNTVQVFYLTWQPAGITKLQMNALH